MSNRFHVPIQSHRGIDIYIGIDDTDSQSGMCTTYLAVELLSEFSECDVIGYPSLVRLNPNIPWKTRGNGALSIRLGKGAGKKFFIGAIKNKPFCGFERGRDVEIEDIKKRVAKIVESNARFEDKTTNPAFVIMEKKPPQWLYWKAVRDIVNLKEVIAILKKEHAQYKGYKNKRGLIGATSAISWHPGDRTYEIITYRERKRWGTKRRVSLDSVVRMDRRFPSTFNNYDYRNKVVVIAPKSPCPVLFGIRGDNPHDLPGALELIESEKRAACILFKTNQGTDDHLKRCKIGDIKFYSSVITKGTVSRLPGTIEGGHVIFSIKDAKEIDCAAYEPTKEFRDIVRQLVLGDVVTVYGGVRKSPITINIEKMRVEKLIEVKIKLENPRCPRCKTSMKSIGKDAGFRCKKCGTKAGVQEAKYDIVKRDLGLEMYEVPVCAKRHLSKPLVRITSSRKGRYS